jgi:LacI family transcriptional regulator
MQKNTLITISKRTGFSISTVSRVLNGKATKSRISNETVKIITEEAKKCNYTPSLLAKSLRTSKTHTIGLLIPSIENPYFANIASIVICEAKKCNYTVVLMDTMESEENEQAGIASLRARQVDGIIVAPCGQDPSYLEDIDQNDIPVVLIDRYFEHTTLSYVCTNNYQGSYDAVNLLIKNGHKNILCIQGVQHSMPSKERIKGYLAALKNNGLIHKKRIVGSDFSIRNGYLETKLVLNDSDVPTAMFVMSNTILLGAIKAIRESNLKVPEDISIVSFDNHTYLDFLDPAITRISQPIREIGTLSIKILTQKMETHKPVNAKIQLPPELVLGKSIKQI